MTGKCLLIMKLYDPKHHHSVNIRINQTNNRAGSNAWICLPS